MQDGASKLQFWVLKQSSDQGRRVHLSDTGQLKVTTDAIPVGRSSVPTDNATTHTKPTTGNTPKERRSVPTDDAKSHTKPTTSHKTAKHSVPTNDTNANLQFLLKAEYKNSIRAW